MKSQILFSILSFLSFFTFIHCLNEDCYVQGSCTTGYHVEHILNISYFQCHQECQDYIGVPDCTYFTYDYQSNLCLFMSECQGISAELCSTCYTTEATCELYDCSLSGMCQGSIVEETYADSEVQCLTRCYNNVNCDYYTYDTWVGYCLLTSECVNPQGSTTSFSVYGQKECYDYIQDSSSGGNGNGNSTTTDGALQYQGNMALMASLLLPYLYIAQ